MRIEKKSGGIYLQITNYTSLIIISNRWRQQSICFKNTFTTLCFAKYLLILDFVFIRVPVQVERMKYRPTDVCTDLASVSSGPGNDR